MKSFNMAKNHLKNFTNHIRQKLGTPVFLNNYEYCTNWCLMHFWHSVHYGKSLVLLIYLKINISAVFHVSFNNYFLKLFCLLICWCWIIYIYIYIYIYYICIYIYIYILYMYIYIYILYMYILNFLSTFNPGHIYSWNQVSNLLSLKGKFYLVCNADKLCTMKKNQAKYQLRENHDTY